MTAPEQPEQLPRFTARHSVRYGGWGVFERLDDSYTWARRGATEATAKHLAAVLNAAVPREMHQWPLRRMLAPTAHPDIPTT